MLKKDFKNRPSKMGVLIALIMMKGCLLTGCQGCSMTPCSKSISAESIQNSMLHLAGSPYKHFQQVPGGGFNPSSYFTCGDYQNPCHVYSEIKNKNIELQKNRLSNSSKRRTSHV